MSGTGKVIVVDSVSEPQTGKASRRVTVQRDSDDSWVDFYIPKGGEEPAVGDAITWGPRHAEFNGHKVKKSYEHDPNEPLH